MKSIWSKLYDDTKDRRYAALFVLVPLAIFICLSILAGLVESSEILEHVTEGELLWAGGLVVGWVFVCVVVTIRRSRKHRPEHWERRELSCDERRVARSKLKSGMNKFKSVKPVSRPLDLDLKM
jgi:hypothetical protein